MDQSSIKLARIQEERLNSHSLDGSHSARGAAGIDLAGKEDPQQANLAQVLDFQEMKLKNFQLNFENLIHIEDKL